MNAPELFVDYFKVFWQMADNRCKLFYGTDRPNCWAVSFESLVYFKHKVKGLKKELNRPLRIMDAGAGASSAMLRHWFPEDTIITCDTDADYLAIVRGTCYVLGLKYNISSLNSGEWHTGYNTQSVDAAYYDYSSGVIREENFPLALTYTQRMMYIDDADTNRPGSAAMRNKSLALCPKYGWKCQDVLEAEDEAGRWGIFATRI